MIIAEKMMKQKFYDQLKKIKLHAQSKLKLKVSGDRRNQAYGCSISGNPPDSCAGSNESIKKTMA